MQRVDAAAPQGSPAPANAAVALRSMGIRAEWAAAPAALRGWVARELGSPVVSARTQLGGFSPGVAARLMCADGTRAFVKAVGSELNPHTPDLVRTEREVLIALPESRHRPRLLSAYDQDGWAALLLEDIDGRMPDLPWTQPELSRTMDALGELAFELTPSPWGGAPRAVDELTKFFTGWQELRAAPPDDLDPWAVRHLDRLTDIERAFALATDVGETLCHVDARSDNILLTADRVVLVDWNWAAVGPAWLDSLTLGFEVITAGGDLAPLLESPVLRGLDPDLVLACMAAGAGMMQWTSRQPSPPGLPSIRAWQGRYAVALTAWTRARTGWR